MTDEDLQFAYQKLRPHTQIESCECDKVMGILLVDVFSDNPIHCQDCRREVDPERLNLSATEVDAIAHWKCTVRALYWLWLHSGDYESYAKAALLDPKGQVNQEGLQVAKTLSERIPTRLWYFHDTDDGEPTSCPICQRPLVSNVKWGTGKCDECRIQI